jgi:glycosyltransferase involved in cell wall biosynthesis
MYDQFDAYFGPHAPFYQQMGANFFKNYLVDWDIKSNENVDVMIANSNFVKMRIQSFYNIFPKVIHPFVELSDFEKFKDNPVKKEDFYIIVTAFAPNKRVDLGIKAFNQLGLKLKIIGSGQQEEYLKSMAGPNVEFLGGTSREVLVDQLSKARALIFPGVEDFGITPLEALAAGTPVIAYKIGGVLETLNDQVAQFFEEHTPESLVEAVKKFESKKFQHSQLIQRAHDFSKDNFKKKILLVVEECLGHLGQRPTQPS